MYGRPSTEHTLTIDRMQDGQNWAQKWVGDRIRQLREQHGIAQEELADRCGINRTHLSKIERGKISPSVVTLSQIVGKLNITMSSFFDGWPHDDKS